MASQSVLEVKSTFSLPPELGALLREEGTEGIWEVSPREWRAYFREELPGLSERAARVGPGIAAGWSVEPEVDWVGRHRSTLRPLPVGRRFAVLPSPDHGNPWQDRLSLRPAPGSAFGTGDHFTTASCLRTLESLRPAPGRVLDLGCGTGILAAGAALIGSGFVAACDIDREAVRVSCGTFRTNGVRVLLFAGGMQAVRGRFDCILANLVGETLVDLMGDLSEALGEGGHLILSGVLLQKAGMVMEAAEASGLAMIQFRTDGEWWTSTLRR